MKLNELVQYIEETYPTSLACSWDNVGLMVGDLDTEINTVYTVIEINETVIKDAIKHNVDLIITHHPFIFSKLSNVTTASLKGNSIYQLLQNNIAVYSMHTNFDIAFDGMNDYCMRYLGYEPTGCFEFETIPDEYVEKHNYKRPGLGRLCVLENEISMKDLCHKVKEAFAMESLRYVGNLEDNIKTIAVVTGAGAEYFGEAKKAGADVLITGDLKYHIAQDAVDQGMNIIDCGHYETEHIFAEAMAKFIGKLDGIQVVCIHHMSY